MRSLWMFPGQGSQKAKMLQDLPQVQKDLVTQLTGVVLNDKEYTESVETQLAITSLQMYQVDILKKAGYLPTVVAGHSLGVFAAAYAIGVMSKEDVLKLVYQRANLMKNAYNPAEYGMGVILGLTRSEVEEIVSQVNSVSNPIFTSNQNAPTQVAISGKKVAIQQVMQLALRKGASKAKMLAVPVLSHTPLLNEVADQLESYSKQLNFKEPQGLYLANYNGHLQRKSKKIKYDLTHNLAYPVYWDTMLDVATELDLDVAVEFSPGKVLTSLLSHKCQKIKKVPLSQYGIDDGLYLLDKWETKK